MHNGPGTVETISLQVLTTGMNKAPHIRETRSNRHIITKGPLNVLRNGPRAFGAMSEGTTNYVCQ